MLENPASISPPRGDLPPKKESSVNVRLGVEKGGRMVRKGYTPEQIIKMFRIGKS